MLRLGCGLALGVSLRVGVEESLILSHGVLAYDKKNSMA